MKFIKTVLIIVTTLLTTNTFADWEAVEAPIGDEGMQVTGKKIYVSGDGGIIFTVPTLASGGTSSGGGGPGSVSGGSNMGTVIEVNNPDLSEGQKNEQNEKNKKEAKKDFTIKGLVDSIKDALKWSKNIVNGNAYFIDVELDGNRCREGGLAIGDKSLPVMKCAEILQSGQKVTQPNGQKTDQFNLYIKVKDYCYYSGKCPETTYEFTAGSKEEMDAILTEIKNG